MTSLRHALRSLRRTPAFTAAATLTLVLGVGSVAAAFAIVYSVLLAPLPFGRPDRLVSIGLRTADLPRIQQPLAAYFTYKRFAHLVDDLGFYRTGNGNVWASGAGADLAERVTTTWVTASTLRILQVRPMLGRLFTDADDHLRDPNTVILSESVWRTRFHASPDIIGRRLYVNSVPRTVVGVMPEGFAFPDADTKLWLPSRTDSSNVAIAGDFTYQGVARLVPGATPAAAQRELAGVLPRMAELFPTLESGTATTAWLGQAHPTPVVVSLRDEMTSGIARTLWMLALAAALVLLVAWANVTNLMLIRADGRQLELAVREALGASRLRVVTHFLGESLALAAAAGVVALLAAWAAVRALVAFGPADVPRLAELAIRAATVAFVVLVSVLGAVVCGVVPAIRIRRAALSVSLRDGGRGDTAGKSRQRLRATIAALQIAVALVVTVGSALLLRTFRRLYEEPRGFDATNVVTIWTQLPYARYADSNSVTFYARLSEAVSHAPGVLDVGLTTRLPLGPGDARHQSFELDDGRSISLPVDTADSAYFGAMRVPIVAGRGFASIGVQRDGDVIISRRGAAALWHDASGRAAVGRRLTLEPSGPAYTIVGVAGDVRDRDLSIAPSALLYAPPAVPIEPRVEPDVRHSMALVIRTSGPPSAVVPVVRRIVHELDPAVPIFNVETMSDVVRASTARLSLMLTLMTAAAAITLVLGMIGLYGVIAYGVALRTRELGVRVALGADPARLARSVAARGLALLAGGLAAGLLLYAGAAPFLAVFLYGVTPGDPLTLAAATLGLVAIGVLASWLPARRAARVDPAIALRSE